MKTYWIVLEAYALAAECAQDDVAIHDQATLDVMNEAWTLAKREGFSK